MLKHEKDNLLNFLVLVIIVVSINLYGNIQSEWRLLPLMLASFFTGFNYARIGFYIERMRK